VPAASCEVELRKSVAVLPSESGAAETCGARRREWFAPLPSPFSLTTKAFTPVPNAARRSASQVQHRTCPIPLSRARRRLRHRPLRAVGEYHTTNTDNLARDAARHHNLKHKHG